MHGRIQWISHQFFLKIKRFKRYRSGSLVMHGGRIQRISHQFFLKIKKIQEWILGNAWPYPVDQSPLPATPQPPHSTLALWFHQLVDSLHQSIGIQCLGISTASSTSAAASQSPARRVSEAVSLGQPHTDDLLIINPPKLFFAKYLHI